MISVVRYDAEVAARFDALSHRFKTTLDPVDHRLRAIVEALAPLERPAILDVGCGKGRFTKHLARIASSIVGVDVSQRMLREAEGVPKARASACRLPFADASFDAVTAVEVIEHLQSIDVFLDESLRVLRPGGKLVVVDKNVLSLDHNRPWIPSLIVKWIDEHRGRWMYPARGPVREQWFRPRVVANQLKKRFMDISTHFLISEDEKHYRVFRDVPVTRLMVRWTATAPGRAA